MSTISTPTASEQRSTKSRGVYIILGIFFGLLGIHNFYAGHYRRGGWELALAILLGWTLVVPMCVLLWVIGELLSVKVDGEGQPMIL